MDVHVYSMLFSALRITQVLSLVAFGLSAGLHIIYCPRLVAMSKRCRKPSWKVIASFETEDTMK